MDLICSSGEFVPASGLMLAAASPFLKHLLSIEVPAMTGQDAPTHVISLPDVDAAALKMFLK